MQTGKSWFGKPYEPNTFSMRVAVLKSFLKHSDLPKLDMKDIMSIEIPEQDILSVSSKAILDNAAVDKLIAHASYPRDRAWFTVLFEAGCRGIEAAGLQWKDVAFQDDGTIILTILSMKRKSKKKPRIRNAYILERGSYLRELRQLQASDTEEDYVFRSIHGGPNMVTTKEGVLYNSMSKMLERTAARAGVVLPPGEKTKLLRASSVTDKRLRGVPDNLIKDSTWAAGENSSMMTHYSRLSPKNKLDAFKAAYGITPAPTKTPPAAETITCIRCGSRNAPLTKFCPKCDAPMTSDAMRERAMVSEVAAELLKDDEFRKRLDEHMKK
jgi:integrase